MTTQGGKHRCWKLGIVSLVIGGAIATTTQLKAQVTSDGTLGTRVNNSTLPCNSGTCTITGGTQAGGNLFHSFKDFSVPNGGTAFFNYDIGSIRNIINRVTGTNASDINGLIKANGTANLFLINPNGIIFGPKARLDIGGSFVASTASAIKFADGSFLSATDTATKPLLSINVPIGVQLGTNQSGSLVNAGNLEVKPGQNLTLMAGTVASTGQLSAPSGQVAVVTASQPGVYSLSVPGQLLSNDVGIASSGSSLSLAQLLSSSGYNTGLTVSADGKVQQASGVGVEAGDIVAQRVSAKDATLWAGRNLTLVESQLSTTGNLNLLAQDTVWVRDSVANPFMAQAGGDLTIQGNRGIDILALNHPTQTPFVSGGNLSLVSDGIISGDAHFASDGSFSIRSLSGGLANFVSVHDPIISADGDVDFASNYKGTSLLVEAKGNIRFQGNINITGPDTSGLPAGPDTSTLSTSSALILRSGQSTLAYGGGNSGNAPVYSTTGPVPPGITLGGNVTLQRFNGSGGTVKLSAASGDVSTEAIAANGGAIDITSAGSVSVISGQISSQNYGTGKGGDINITALSGSVFVQNGAQLTASTFGQGDAGSVTINAHDGVTFDGVNRNGRRSGAFSLVESGAVGMGGNVNVTAGSLTVKNGAELTASTFGQGNAGNVNINVRDATIFDGVYNKDKPSGAFSNVQAVGAQGKGGEVNISTGSLSVTGGAQINAFTRGKGDAGNVNITARDAVTFDGVSSDGSLSGAASSVLDTGVGKGGNVNVTAESLTVKNGAEIAARTYGNGDGGSVNIKTGSLSVTGGAQVSASTFAQANAGRVTINARDDVTLDGNPSGIFSQVNPGGTGNAGSISISADRLFIRNGATVDVNGLSRQAGDIAVTARRLILDNQGSITAKSTQGSGGNINLQGVREYVVLSRNSKITTESGSKNAGGDGGNITIKTPFIIATPQKNSYIDANAYRGNGGKINIGRTRLFDIAARQPSSETNYISASSQLGINGVVQVNALNIDPSRAFSNLSNASLPELLAEGCRPNGRPAPKNKFYITGRGGLPPNPGERPGSGAVAEDLGSDLGKLISEAGKNQEIPSTLPAPDTQGRHPVIAPTAPSTEVVEAQGWVRAANGDVYIVAQAPTVTPHSVGLQPVTCHEP